MVRTSKTERKSQPAPAPKTPVAERLEHVREIRGVPTLSEFHRKLLERRGEDDNFQVSYAAARNYHYDRDAPASYLVRVAEVFNVRLPWLLTGEGEPTEFETAVSKRQKKSPEDAAIEQTLVMIAHLFPDFSRIQPWAHRVFWQTIIRLVRYRTAHNADGLSNVRIAQHSAVLVATQIANPIREIEPGNLTDDQLSDYVASICQVLMRLIPSGGTARVETPAEEA